ncbi:unnamed protein product [Mytilus coruscus]|uniref:Mab-21-like HhH/H2TH-like domain-containing protein n=1 Tax=Mytilus coruscus TaxID=42192 RepID=A0A6J8EQD6_MYTCO|nr:unnamed protein product [Mytilus coruscus]
MSRQRDDSLHFYEYLCQKIGSEEDVKARRITSIVCDIGSGRFRPIRSGSNGEGLNLKGSDVDLMMISSDFAVYEYFSDIPARSQKIPLVMDTDDTQPCFTKLKILCDRTPLCIPDKLSQADHKGIVLSSKMFKEIQLDRLSTKFKYFDKLHGPCVADNNDQLDLVICLKKNNLFYLRFNEMNRNKLCNLIKMSYQQGIQCLFATETLMDYPKYSGEINQPLCRNARLVNEIKQTISCGIYAVEEYIYMLLSILLHYSRGGMSADIITFFLLRAHQIVPQRLQIPQGSNKLKYIKYQNIISHLLVGVHTDTVTGWIMLACFFYERKQYIKTLSIINYVVLKFTDEKIPIDKSSLNRKQICALNMIANEKLMTSLQTLTTHTLVFVQRSLIIPTELQLDVQKHDFLIHPKLFAHFLGFLCCYHLKDSASCNYFIHQLLQVLKNIINSKKRIDAADVHYIFICIGIAMQMIGETNSARNCLQRASAIDVYNLTSANILLAELNFND